MAAGAAAPRITPRPPGCEAPPAEPAAPPSATPEESAAVLKAACRELALEAEREGRELEEVAPLCHRKYGRGAFCVHFAAVTDTAAAGRGALTIDEWLELSVRRSYPLQGDGPVPQRVLDAARAFSCDCPEGLLGRRVAFRRAERLLEQLPELGSEESRAALEGYDCHAEFCVCGEVAAGGDAGADVLTVVGSLPVEFLAARQREQRERWTATREHVERLKAWGNEELRDRDLSGGAELAEKTYREALRLLLESCLEDAALELALRLNLAEALARLERWAGSEEESAAALRLEPKCAKALYRRGRARLRLGLTEQARGDLLQAAQAAPRDRFVREEFEKARRDVLAVSPAAPSAAPAAGSTTTNPRVARPESCPAWLQRGPALLRRAAGAAALGLWRQLLLTAAAVALLSRAGRLRRRWAVAR